MHVDQLLKDFMTFVTGYKGIFTLALILEHLRCAVGYAHGSTYYA